jgi:hypothetical protein
VPARLMRLELVCSGCDEQDDSEALAA